MQRTGASTVIASVGDTGRAGTVGLVVTGLLTLGAVATLVGGAFITIPLILAVFAAVLGVFSARAVGISRRMDPGVLHVATDVLLLSSEVPATFRRRVKRGSREATSVTARLVLEEFVSYQAGTERQTQTHEVWSGPVPTQPRPDPEGVAVDVVLRIPGYPPTIDAPSNKVRWFLVVDLTMADGFTEDSRIPLHVAPAVHTPRGRT